jgi:hypothetical protein
MTYEIFQCNGINGSADWFVDGPDSSSFYLGTFSRSLPTIKQLQYFAKKILTEKARKYGFEGEIPEFPLPVRKRDLAKVTGMEAG